MGRFFGCCAVFIVAGAIILANVAVCSRVLARQRPMKNPKLLFYKGLRLSYKFSFVLAPALHFAWAVIFLMDIPMSALSRTLLTTSVIGSLALAGYLWKDEQNQVDFNFAEATTSTPALMSIDATAPSQFAALDIAPVGTAATEAQFGEAPVLAAVNPRRFAAQSTDASDDSAPAPVRRMTRAVEQ